jgi:xanthine dehydrogenase iron-sulfur cluster and FAD-binding subunit A
MLDENPNPTEVDVKEAPSGVICRCTGYVKPICRRPPSPAAAAELRQAKGVAPA